VAQAEAAGREATEQLRLKAQPYTPEDLEQQRQGVAQAEAQLALKLQAQGIAAQRQAVAEAAATLDLKAAPYTDHDVAAAVAAVNQARGQVASAQYNLDNALLLAPFDATVSDVGLHAGELATGAATVGGGLITLVNSEHLRVDARVDEASILRVAVGQPVRLTLDALPGQRLNGRVTAIAPQSVTQQGVTSYAVSIALDEPQRVRPGMTATANVVYDRHADVLLVPNRTIRSQGNDQVVDVLRADGATETRVVALGLSNDQQTEITEGVAEGERVVVPRRVPSTSTTPQGAGSLSGPGMFGGPPPPR
jgi:HlyD family secretion protein